MNESAVNSSAFAPLMESTSNANDAIVTQRRTISRCLFFLCAGLWGLQTVAEQQKAKWIIRKWERKRNFCTLGSFTPVLQNLCVYVLDNAVCLESCLEAM